MEWSFSPFLQALGWAAINSFWQMAFLWVCYSAIHYCFQLSSRRSYILGISGIFSGFTWFIISFFEYFLNGSTPLLTGINQLRFSHYFPLFLNAASVAYLILLIFPTYEAFRNWQFILFIKQKGLKKAPLNYRLYINKISNQLGIFKTVKVFISDFIKSPVTVGFLKPVILLPVAAFNNLSPAQIEAVLLHELAHIRRHDFLINLLLTVMQVILYFNPFLKFFIKRIEIERENCCDEMVVQFEYDRFEYASALLQLEKNAGTYHFAMAAANSNHLLHRIQKIAGINKKSFFNVRPWTIVFLGAFSLIIASNLSNSGKTPTLDYTPGFVTSMTFPVTYPNDQNIQSNVRTSKEESTPPATQLKAYSDKVDLSNQHIQSFRDEDVFVEEFSDVEDKPAHFIPVGLAGSGIVISTQEKHKQITKTIENTKKVLAIQWKEVEKSMGEALSPEEKDVAKLQYFGELEKMDWEKLEKSLETQYAQVNWKKLDMQLDLAISIAQIDSIESHIKEILVLLNKPLSLSNLPTLPFPDVSLKEHAQSKLEIQNQLKAVQRLKIKKIVRI